MMTPYSTNCVLRRNFRPIQSASIGAILIVLLGYSSDAYAGDPLRSSISSGRLDLGEVFTFFFLMLGPIKILGPFVTMTDRVESSFSRQLAVRATIFSCLALVVAVLIGEKILDNYDISLNMLAFTGGLVLSVVAFQTILEQFQPYQEAEGDCRHWTLPYFVWPSRLLLRRTVLQPLSFYRRCIRHIDKNCRYGDGARCPLARFARHAFARPLLNG